MNKIVLIGAVLGALLVGGGGVAYYFTSMNPPESAEPVKDDRSFLYVEVPPVVANFEYQGSMRYLQVTVNLQTRSPDSAKLMDENAPLIQGEILMLMQELDFAVVRTVEGKRALIAQIEASIRGLFDALTDDAFELERVVLTGFVVQ